ncbi:MAG: S-layer protein [Coleofasciculus sp. B1-GNL1-01]|uniref:S-layer protein n=1 Tax=Coleofasciculus sp. B1-GNL1-01 TaxID=3068484 RepID=UPI0032F3CC8B
MKLRLLTVLTLVASTSFVVPAKAQDTQPVQSFSAVQLSQEQVNREQLLEACAKNRADSLPNPFTDVSPTHWAYKAVLSMYYCGAYRGSIPPEQVKPLLGE